MLCIRKTLEHGLIGAITVGLGAAIADSMYGVIAALGISTVSVFLIDKAIYIKALGGIFLLYLSYKELNNTPQANIIHARSKGLIKLILEVCFLTITNPMTILSFIGIFASLSSGPTTYIESLVMVIGIFLGSMTWWLLLGSIIIKIRDKLPETWIYRIKYLSAIILSVFGSYSLYSVIF
ncbi:MAG: Lysine exporter protein [Rickettsiaceae bacterium]|jgi:putative LysE/RhtB family amino acid efflux pump|nr:Lysine exporter protein [Rickettsiaceae bacterium]